MTHLTWIIDSALYSIVANVTLRLLCNLARRPYLSIYDKLTHVLIHLDHLWGQRTVAQTLHTWMQLLRACASSVFILNPLRFSRGQLHSPRACHYRQACASQIECSRRGALLCIAHGHLLLQLWRWLRLRLHMILANANMTLDIGDSCIVLATSWDDCFHVSYFDVLLLVTGREASCRMTSGHT